MLKTRKRWISLLVAVAMVAVLLVPFAGTASASCTYAMTTVNTVVAGNGTPQQLGALEATFDLPSWDSTTTASAVYLALPSSPSGYAFVVAGMTLASPTITLPANDIVGGTGTVTATGLNWVGGYPTQLSVSVIHGAAGTGNPTSVTLEVPLTLMVPSGVTGNITLTASAESGSIFASGQVVVGTVGNSTVTLAVESTPSISSSGGYIGVIDVTENAAGALYDNGATGLKLTLPPGFSWATNGNASGNEVQQASGYPELVWGSAAPSTISGTSNNGRELDITYATPTTSAAFFKVDVFVNVDQSTAQTGNITVSVSGQTSANVSSVVVGSYGNFGITASAQGTAPTITAGVEGSTIGELEIAEGIPGSLIWGRTVTLTLPTNVDWTEVPSLDTSLSTNTGSIGGSFGDWTSVGSSGAEIQCTLPPSGALAGPTAGQSSPGAFFLKNMEVTPAVDFSGPVTVTVGGSEGLTGTVTLATVAAGITASAASAPAVSIGSAAQTLGDLTVTEAAAGNIGSTAYNSGLLDNPSAGTASPQYLVAESNTEGNAYLYIVAPVGVTFDTTPAVTVTSGNLQLGTITTTTTATAANQGEISIEILGSSTTASTIKIAAPVVTIDRTVPQGPVTFKVEGTAVDQTELGSWNGGVTGNETIAALFPNDTDAAKVDVANVTTGVNGQTNSGVVVFSIGQASYTVNGTSVSTDVAPYIKDSRTFVPLRAVANALGVPDSGIIWDPTSDKVTIIKGSLVAQFTIGSDIMLLNGATITMDTAPEITDGRTCLPIAWAAQALGVTYTWDGTAQTVTFGTPSTPTTSGLPSAPSGGSATTNPTTSTTTNPTTTP